ncbi:MAG: GYDIA family GHMP kinase [Bacteroidales bacterium]
MVENSTDKKQQYAAHGKLMISGEYLVLAGAKALAMPVCYGQTLRIEPLNSDTHKLTWKTLVKGQPWLNIVFQGEELLPHTNKPLSDEQSSALHFLQGVLQEAKRLNPAFLSGKHDMKAEADIDFDLRWGLGSSSSLIANIASWADINPFDLFFRVSQGSGYDVACAGIRVPILYHYQGRYRYPGIEPVSFNPSFRGQIVFIYRGRKQNSADSVARFDRRNTSAEAVREISGISQQMAASGNLNDFMGLMRRHEAIISDVLQQQPVREGLFPDFPGAVKSLGAWGGDFLMAAADLPTDDIIRYFSTMGYGIAIPFQDMQISHTNTTKDD